MAYFPDLSDAGPTLNERGSYFAEGAVYVGWLAPEDGHDFPKATVIEISVEFLQALKWLTESSTPGPVQVFSTRGFHACPLCEMGMDRRRETSSRHFIVPGPDRNYLVPAMLAHYVDYHSYAVPAEFEEALIAVYRRR